MGKVRAYKINSEIAMDPNSDSRFQKSHSSMTTKDDSIESFEFYIQYVVDSIIEMDRGEVEKITLEMTK